MKAEGRSPMDQALLREREGLCTQENPPKCMAECPVHVDVRGVIKALKNKDYSGAYKLYSRAVPFPSIISHVCEEPCSHQCLRNELDSPVRLRELEKHIVKEGKKAQGKVLVPPSKGRQVAVVGSGLSALTLAKTLKLKGYEITIFEKHSALGGKLLALNETQLPREVLEAELDELTSLNLNLKLNQGVGKGETVSWSQLKEGFEAIYLDLPAEAFESCTEGLIRCFSRETTKGSVLGITLNPLTLETEVEGVFAGGGIRRMEEAYSPIRSISDGKIAANSIDRLLQKVSLSANRVNEASMETKLYTNIEGEALLEAVHPKDPELGYSSEEAMLEAERCLLCECMECVKACVYMSHYKGYPKRYFREIYNNLSIVMGIHFSNKMINTCSECGLCAHICPNGADMGEVVQEARNHMVEKGKMPPSAHDFALRDMAFSKSDKFATFRLEPEHETIQYLYFPGCQLAGSKPEHVENSYKWLCESLEGGVGLMLDCCGAPAQWSGRKDLFSESLAELKDLWEQQGRPKVILACPSCYRVFNEELPEMEIEMLYSLMGRSEHLPRATEGKYNQTLAVHDSCSTRFHSELHDSVRGLITKMGYEVEELPLSKDKTTCCGYGGLMMFADKDMAEKVISKRIGESPSDYLVYCAMCRDNFAGQGKKTYHLLDLIFGAGSEVNASPGSPDFSQRHENRFRLKQNLLASLWGEKIEEGKAMIQLSFSQDVRTLMEKRCILVEDVERVMENMEKTGQKMLNPESNLYLTYFKPGAVTYWVEFRINENVYEIVNAYSHRLEIES